jgi:hypothetical protein
MEEAPIQPINPEEELVVLREVIDSLSDKVLERKKEHPEEDELTSIRRVVHSSPKVRREDRTKVREEVSAELMHRLNEKYQARTDQKHSRHWMEGRDNY